MRTKRLYERTINRAIHRYSQRFTFICANGQLEICGYKSRPTFLEDGELGRRVAEGYEITIPAATFNAISNLAGSGGLFDLSCKLDDGEGAFYLFDRLTPFQSLALESGYKLLVKKVKNETA